MLNVFYKDTKRKHFHNANPQTMRARIAIRKNKQFVRTANVCPCGRAGTGGFWQTQK